MTRLDYELFLKTKLPVPFKDEEGNDIVTLKDLDKIVQKELSFYDSELEERIYFEFELDKEQNVKILFWYKDEKINSLYDIYIYKQLNENKQLYLILKINLIVKYKIIGECLRIQEEQAEQKQKEINETKKAVSRANGWWH